MIKIASTVKLSFIFPANWETAFTYYSDFPRIVTFLPHIQLVPVETIAENEYRLWYNTVELGRYHIHVYCDVRMELDWEQRVIRLMPIQNFPAIPTKVTVNATSTRGYYSSEGHFFALDDEEATRIEYTLRMKATPPKPKGMKLIPGKLVDSVAQNITANRMKEVANGFIESSVQGFPQWHDEQEAIKRDA